MDEMIGVPFENEEIPAFLLTSQQPGLESGIILIHEVWGLTPQLKDVAARLGAHGWTVLAPDLMAGTVAEGLFSSEVLARRRAVRTPEEAAGIMAPLLPVVETSKFHQQTAPKVQACFNFLKGRGLDRIAAMGFCFGGGYSLVLAVVEPALAACVAFYGASPEPIDLIQGISCPVLALYGERDARLVGRLPELREAVEKYHKDFTIIVYPNCGHAFFNDSIPMTYNAAAATDSWEKTLALLKDRLG